MARILFPLSEMRGCLRLLISLPRRDELLKNFRRFSRNDGEPPLEWRDGGSVFPVRIRWLRHGGSGSDRAEYGSGMPAATLLPKFRGSEWIEQRGFRAKAAQSLKRVHQ